MAIIIIKKGNILIILDYQSFFLSTLYVHMLIIINQVFNYKINKNNKECILVLNNIIHT